LATQGLPRWQGDANCTLNLGILLLFHRLRAFSYLSGLKLILNRFSFTEGRRKTVHDAWTRSSCARAWVCASVYVYRIHMKGTLLLRDPFVGFNKAQRSSPLLPFLCVLFKTGCLHLNRFFYAIFAESIDSSVRMSGNSFFFTVLLTPSHLSCMSTWQGHNRINFTSIHLHTVALFV